MVFDPVTAAALGYGGYRLLRRLFEGEAPLARPPAAAPPVAVPPAPPAPSPYPFTLFTPDRGAHRTTQDEALRYMLADPGPLFELAGMWLPAREYLNKLTLVTGRPGAGKTTLEKLMIQSIAKLFPVLAAQSRLGLYPGNGDMRWATIDPTNKYLPYLYQVLPLDVPIVRISPHDAGGVAWDVAKDITNEARNTTFQTALLPDALFQKAGDPFWLTKAREVTQGLVSVYLDRHSDWRFEDLVIPIKYPQFLRPVLMQCDRTRGLAKHDLVGRLGRDIITTCSATINKLALAAALWQRATTRYSMTQFLRERAVLHFAFSPDMAAALGGVANALLSVIVLLAIERDEEFNHTLLLADESKYLSDISCMDELAARGRGAGLGAFLTAQAVTGLIAKWGESRVKELLELLACWVTLSAGSETAAAFSRLVGDVEGVAESYGNNSTFGHTTTTGSSYGGTSGPGLFGQPTGTNWNYSSSSSSSSSYTNSQSFQLVTKPAVLPSEVTNLRNADAISDTISGFMFNAGVGAWSFEATFMDQFRNLPPAPFAAMPTRPPEDQILTPWSIDDINRLGLTMTEEMMKALHLTWGKRRRT